MAEGIGSSSDRRPCLSGVNPSSGTASRSAGAGSGSATHQPGRQGRLPLRMAWLIVAVGIAATFSHAAESSKPDILIIMPDQFRGDCLSAVGHPVVRTPTLDALAAEGTLFRRGYASVPSCIPARFALLTGQEPQTSGIVGFTSRPITVPTLPGVLAAAGYATALVGRNMHQVPATDSLGYATRLMASTYIADDDYDLELKKTLPQAGGIRGIVGLLRLDNNRWPAAPWPHAEEFHPTAWIVRRSREVVASAPREKPLFLTTSFYAPHPPLFPPARLFEKYMNAKLPATAMGTWVDRAALRPEGNQAGNRVRLEGETLRRAQAGYFGLIEHIDEQIAGLVADFKARSARAGRPWVIVVITDHGEMLGDHGYFRKCEPYEGSANIPYLIASAPELKLKRGTRSFQPVGQEDIMPTLLELANVKRPESVDGRSLVPILKDADARVRDWLHFEHAPTYTREQGFHALTDGRFKYIWRPHDGSEQLFDLSRDAHEEKNLASDEAHRPVLNQWRARLVERLDGRPEGFSDGKVLIAGREYPRIQTAPKPKR
jgi:arylsulfatase